MDYEYVYMNNTVIFNIGQKLLNGFLTLEGRTKIKEDITGIVKTGIIQIPKLKIMSNLSMRLGKDAGPQMGGFNAVAVPVGSRGESTFMKVMILDDDSKNSSNFVDFDSWVLQNAQNDSDENERKRF